MLLIDLVRISHDLKATSARSEKTTLLAGMISRLSAEETPAAVSFLSGAPRQSPLGIGYASVHGVEVAPAEAHQLQILDVDTVLEEISKESGPGSKNRRHDLVKGLMSRATQEEQDFLRGLMLRNLRQGALEGVMADAVAVALDVPAEGVRRAVMLEGDLVAVASNALTQGPESLAQATLTTFTPVQPMLAKAAESVTEAIAAVGLSVVEHKLDGLRLQVHKAGDRIEIYTRNLRRVTSEMGSVVASARRLKASSLILDGEGLLIGPGGRPMSFQDSMSGRAEGNPGSFTAFYFDVLQLDGEDLIDLPLSERRRRLAEVVPEDHAVGSVETSDPRIGESFFTHAVESGYEGVVVKDPSQPYAAGRRGSGWLKVKPTHTLDLVILAAEWGSGRRQGWLSNLHLGARGPDGDLVMLGKTFKGLTDEMLSWQTARFLEIEESRDGHVVYLHPEVVYEIAFDGVQRSTRYPGGVALRFARVKGYREDKAPADADTLEMVRSFLH